MNFDPNPLFYEMVRLYSQRPQDDKIIICNEGGTRSSKTWDFFHFLVFYCDQFRNSNQEIYCHRDTLTNCRDYTLKDFINCLKVIGVFDHTKLTSVGQKPYYNLFGNHVFFRGLDDEKNMEGYPSDISFFNELLEVENENKIAGIKMRCRKLIVADWNPKYTAHWAFEYEGRPNTYFTNTTFRNNKHCPKAVISEILSYEPTLENIKNGTSDQFRWDVYGLGKRGAMKGLIFPNVTYIDKFPDIAYTYGLDFGFSVDPCSFVKFAQEGNNIYAELLIYTPIETPEIIKSTFETLKIEQTIPITADSADKYISENKGSIEMVRSLRTYNYQVTKVNKTQGVMFWLLKMKGFKVHIVKNSLYSHARKEAENYRLKEINGIAINQPEDKHNHFWDSLRYAFMAYNSKNSLW